MKPTLEDAIRLAVEAHHGQRDKIAQPYILHPLRVMFRLTTEAERIVAVLHDVVEDTTFTFEDLRKMGYPEDILHALDCVTKREGEVYEDFVLRSKSDPIARNVKLADLEDNMDLRRMAGVTEKDMQRLNRYRKAWALLQQA
jgi:(p)ppGpp synthase/HD superfamily hydrolase